MTKGDIDRPRIMVDIMGKNRRTRLRMVSSHDISYIKKDKVQRGKNDNKKKYLYYTL